MRLRSCSPSAARTSWSPTRIAANAESAWADAREAVVAGNGHGRGARSLVARQHRRARLRATILAFGGVDIVINTAAIYPTPDPSTTRAEAVWARTLHINVTGNYVLAEEAARVLKAQNLPAAMVFTSSANAIVPKSGSEAYDVSKAAINHLIRELAIGLGPLVRVNGIAPATVIAGSSMFPRDRVIVALQEYDIAFADDEPTEALQDEAGGVLRQADDHAPADSAAGLRERDLLAGRRRQREDDGPRHSRWTAAFRTRLLR